MLKIPTNEKVKAIAEELGDLLGLSKYRFTFFYKGDKVGLGDRIGDRGIGLKNNNNEDEFLFCMQGGSDGPIAWKRFLHVDDPQRQLSYISDDEQFDAITFIPKKDI